MSGTPATPIEETNATSAASLPNDTCNQQANHDEVDHQSSNNDISNEKSTTDQQTDYQTTAADEAAPPTALVDGVADSVAEDDGYQQQQQQPLHEDDSSDKKQYSQHCCDDDEDMNHQQSYGDKHHHYSHISTPEQLRKLFVGGVNYKTEEDTLRQYFGKHGEIVDCIVMRDPNGRSRGFAFVTFTNVESVDEVMKSRPHVIDGRDLDVRRATPKEEASKPGGQLSVKKLFIGGCREGVSEDDLKEYFSKYGNVTDCVVMKDADGKFRGFGFVTFDDYDPVDKITLLERTHTVNGHNLDVKKAMPKRKPPMGGSVSPLGGGRHMDGGGMGGWYESSYDSYGSGGGPMYGSRSGSYGRHGGGGSSGLSPYSSGSMRMRRSGGGNGGGYGGGNYYDRF